MIRAYWRLVLLSVASGVLGVLLTLAAVHLWQDHQQLHQAIDWIVRVQQAQAKAAQGTPPEK